MSVLPLVHSADFKRTLSAPQLARSPHFALHYLAALPSQPQWTPRAVRATTHLSPSTALVIDSSVDNFVSESVRNPVGQPVQATVNGERELMRDAACSPEPSSQAPSNHCFGLVVPKRHARRAITRNLLRRQMRSALHEHHTRMPAGLWVLRLRNPFDRASYPSAASSALRRDARRELDELLARAQEAAGAAA